jgi:ankyrin repeat protein
MNPSAPTPPEAFHRLENAIADLIIFCSEIQSTFFERNSIGRSMREPLNELKRWRVLEDKKRRDDASQAESLYRTLIVELVKCDNQQTHLNSSLLGQAIAHGYLPLMIELLEAGAEIDVTPLYGESPLYYAAKDNRIDMLRMLIKTHCEREREKHMALFQQGIDQPINLRTQVKSMAILLESKRVIPRRQSHEALIYKPGAEGLIKTEKQLVDMIQHPRILRALIEERVVHYGNWLMEAVFYVITQGRKDLLDVFIEKQIDFNFINQEGCSPLFLAAKLGHADLIKPLVDAGARINDKNRQGHTPIIEASIHRHETTVEALKELGAEVDLSGPHRMDLFLLPKNLELSKLPRHILIKATKEENLEVFTKLLAAGAEANTQDEDGFTALMFAASRGNVLMVKALIEAKADLNRTTKIHQSRLTGEIWGGSTALMVAAEKGHKDVVKLLILGGADLSIKNKAGQTALDWARNEGHLSLLPILRIGLVREFYRKLVASSPDQVPVLIQEQKRAGVTKEELYQFMLKTETDPDKKKNLLNQALDRSSSLGLYLSISEGLTFKTLFSTPLRPTQVRIQQELYQLERKKPVKGLTYN